MRTAILSLVLCLVGFPLSADEPTRFTLPDGPDDALAAKIDRADARTGIVELTAVDPRREGAEFEEPIGIVEGRYLVIGMAERRSLAGSILFAAEITEVLPKNRFRAKVSTAAIDRFENVNLVVFMRPAGSTTAAMKTVPAVASIVDKSKEITGMGIGESAKLTMSKNNLKQIALAFHNYHDTHKNFPPRAIIGPDGKPWHSWRVLILPFLDQQGLYSRYKFDEPWDGPNNKKLIAEMPDIFRDPIHGKATKDGYTHYAALASTEKARHLGGPLQDAKFNGKVEGLGEAIRQGTGFRDITDGTSNTLLCGSVSPEAKIEWTKPEDVLLVEKFPGLGEKGGFGAPYSGKAGKAAVFAMCDGSVTTITSDVEAQQLRFYLVRGDGNVVGEVPSLDPRRPGRGFRTIPVLEIHETKEGTEAHLIQVIDESRRSSRPDTGRPATSNSATESAPDRPTTTEAPDSAADSSEGSDPRE